MTLAEQYEKETGKRHFDYHNINRTYCTWDYVRWLEAKVMEQSKAVELLRDLADLQNGPPLERHRTAYEETIGLVYELLNKIGA